MSKYRSRSVVRAWTGALALSLGCCWSAAQAQLVINEVDYDQASTDTAEFIEIKNVSASTIDLDPYAVELVNGASGAVVYQTIQLPPFNLAPGAYYVICANAATTPYCNLDVSPNTDLIQNGAPDALAITLGLSLIDVVSYEGSTAAPYTEGSGVGLTDNGTVAFQGLSRFPDGTDTNVNNTNLSLRCATPGKPNAAASTGCPDPLAPKLVINEIDYDQPSTDTAEFVELKNTGGVALNLDPYSVRLVNGSGGAVYATIDLPVFTLPPGGYYVICANAATTPNCNLDVSPNTDLLQNGAPDAVGLVLAGTVVDAVSYEGNTVAPYTESSATSLNDSGAVANLGLSRYPDGADTNVNNTDLSLRCITPGSGNASTTSACPAPTSSSVEIWQIQGAGLASPLVGQTVTTLGNVVTGLAADGFLMQTPDARADADPVTSNGLFVFTSTAPTVVSGDVVDVSGQVQEFFESTQISATSVVRRASGAALPTAVALTATNPSPVPPLASTAFERYENMRVSVAAGTVSGPNQRFASDILAEVHIVTRAGRAFRETGILFPGLAGLPVWDGNPEVFELDPNRLGLPNQEIPAGSTFTATGVLGFEFGGWELWPTSLTVTPATLPRAVRAKAADEYTVGSLNLFRLFDDVDDPGINETVVSVAEYARRLEKFSRYIRTVLGSPDILAVQECEKLSNLDDLAARIQAEDPSVQYVGYLIEGNDVGGIDVGFLVKSGITVAGVTQLGAAETLTVDGSLLHDRPPLLLEASVPSTTGATDLEVLVVHQRSLGSIDDPVDGPRVRQKRLEQAQSVATMVQARQVATPGVRLVVTGDFNAFQFTDGYVDVVGQIRGVVNPAQNLLSGPDLVTPDLTNVVSSLPAAEQYSFIFGGSSQVLDHALVSTGLSSQVRGMAYGRGNADAAVDRLNDAASALRSSDHDGLVLFLAHAP
jgi:predicted extracellular nuclease